MITFALLKQKILIPFFYHSVNFLYPLKCQICHKYLDAYPVEYLCEDCEHKLMKMIIKACIICGKEAPNKSESPFICKTCSAKPYPQIIFLSAGPYEGILKELIHQLKYHRKPFIADPLCKFLIEFLCVQKIDFCIYDYIIPVPLSKTRLRERGFNQSELIATKLSRWSNIPLRTDILCRKHHKYPQASLNRAQRLNNLAGVFKLNKKTVISDKSVILIDDVKSTGSTIYFCAEQLFKAGAKKILSITLSNNA